MKEVDLLFDAAESEKAAASTFAILAAEVGSEELRQKLLQHQNTIQDHQHRFAQLLAEKQGGERNPN